MGFFDKKTADDWYKKGAKLFKDKKYNAAMSNFLQAAKDNHAESQYYLGVLYHYGLRVDVNDSTAYTWFLKAAEQGHTKAQNSIGELHYYGFGVEQDYNAAAEWFMKAAEKGCPTSQNEVGEMYYHGEGFAQSYETAFVWFITAAKGGNKMAEIHLEYLDENVHDTEQNYVKFTKNKPESMHEIGIQFFNAKGVTKNDKEAIIWFTKAAERGHTLSQNKLGSLYLKGQGTSINYEESFKWYKMSSDKGNAIGQRITGYMYYNGLGVERDYDEAFRLYQLAADRDDSAKNSVGDCYKFGHSVELNPNKPFEWYTLSAEVGNEFCQMNLGEMYLDGIGTKINLDLAQEWFEKALKNGHASAQIYLDKVKARKLEYQKLAVETESQREAREAKKQIAILLAKLAVQDSEIEDFKKVANRYGDAEVQQIVHESVPITSAAIAKAELTQDNKDENPKKQPHSKKPLMFFEIPAVNRDDDTEVLQIARQSVPITSNKIAEAGLAQDNTVETPKKPLMFFHL